jgi:hypothetical protein
MPLILVLSVFLFASAVSQDRPLPDPGVFFEQVKQRLQTDDDRQSAYMYVETRREVKLDKAGRPTGESVKVIESYPGFPGQGRWEREISIDGRPTSTRDLEKQDRDRQEQAEEFLKRLEKDPEKTTQRLARERAREQREATKAVNEIFAVYDLRIAGREALEGHDTIVITLTPRRAVKAKTSEGKLMQKFNARAWVSESEYELVRLEVEAIDTVSYGLGVLARMHKGSKGAFQRRKVNGEEWLPASATYTGSARVALLKVMRRDGRSEFSDYKKFSVETSSAFGRSKPIER